MKYVRLDEDPYHGEWKSGLKEVCYTRNVTNASLFEEKDIGNRFRWKGEEERMKNDFGVISGENPLKFLITLPGT